MYTYPIAPTTFANRSVIPCTSISPPPRHSLAQTRITQSLYDTGLKQPEDVVQHCLTLFRKCDVQSLLPHLPPTAPPTPIQIGDSFVQEQGPFAQFSQFLDVGARRVLPGHLLRRSRVIGGLFLSPDSFQQRIALTARTGEESIFIWDLRNVVAEDGNAMGSGSSTDNKINDNSNNKENWIIVSIRRDGESSDYPLPSTPQPKASPESVVLSQLAALQGANIFEASTFNNWQKTDATSNTKGRRRGGRRGFLMGIHYELLRDMVAEEPCAVLTNPHASATLGYAALPAPNTMLQEVVVVCGSTGTVKFVWKLELQVENGCWLCTGIIPILSSSSSLSP